MFTNKRVVRQALKYSVLPLSLLAAGGFVWQASYAAFSATTSNATNQWKAGTVVLADDDAGVARFTALNIVPAQTDTKCIKVTSTANVAGNVKLYLASKTATASLDTYLKFTVQQGTGGDFSTCTGFTADLTGGTIINNQTLAAAALANTSYATAAGSWVTTGVGTETKTYKIQWTFDTTGLSQLQIDALQAATAGITFTWENQNT
ncbi:MAG: hypothetical protein F2681_12775 [Actinobacteria bacterium]|uniref:Unannotated protein n=1 Tax=freshwater metagenome TaxID=449393 RepID=A0A6J7C431_9ZZZZ|nr:hypothetical protein [Actinomycetota bacterium]MSW76321.1 hypothetical protein [Actinomycetota bacterium]MSX56208.1 hypothetical protein [Actinomycetota bacterium]MSZ84004.1 hypothetical protein [Actinomycetota bacterium]MTB16612.1 hypothetical protein [Actinomycetota bacterium]